jgi:thiamine biosynthesis lipoprotein
LTYYKYCFKAFNTPCELSLYDKNKSICDTAANDVLEEAIRLEKKYSFFTNDSVVGTINSRIQPKLSIDEESCKIITESIALSEATNFVFDIALAGTMKKLQSEKNLKTFRKKFDKLMPFAHSNQISISNGSISFSNPYTKIDLGGIVKEYAVDLAAAIIKRHKITSAIVDFGGDMAFVGNKNGEGWNVGIKNPKEPSLDIAVVSLSDKMLATSGHYERNYAVGGKIFSHIVSKVDDKILIPLQASVICDKAMVAGVFATTLAIGGAVVDTTLHPIETVIIQNNLNIDARLTTTLIFINK